MFELLSWRIEYDRSAYHRNQSTYYLISVWSLLVNCQTPDNCRDYEDAAVSSVYPSKFGWLQSWDYSINE